MRIAVLLLLAACPLAAQAPTQAPIRGFPNSMVAVERQREDALHAVPSRDTLRAQMRLLAAVPHEAGTERSHHVAELILARFKSFGLNAQIEQFQALMPRPVSRTLELVAPEHYTAQLKEPALAEDPTSGQEDQLPTFNAYSPDGDVTGDLVYVNYGRPVDYHVLDSLGISVRGKIVIARYGETWRGIKPKVAAEHGAIGCIIYSDPRQDGFFEDDVYPKGPMRPWQGVQRGSVMDMPTYPGDPLSPGWASVPGGHVWPIDSAQTLEKIPVLPISYGDALPLLTHLEGPVAPEEWRGGLPITYHVGPGASRVHLALKFDWQSRPLYDVIATIRGSRYPNQWVVFGNHHDAWVNGANDPISGQVALDETARSLGALLKTGWRPARTIILAAWDGEEWGLLGSTEWGEKHAAELRQNAVVYYNSDTNDRGWFGAAGSHSLQRFFEEVTRDVTDPATGKSALEAWREHRREEHKRDASVDTTFAIGALGSGSDYTVFVDHLSVPTANLAYGGATHDGIYHSIYDSWTFYGRFLDTSYAYGVLQAQTTSTAVLRMADAPVLPFEFGAVAKTYGGYADEIAKLAKENDTTQGLDLSAVKTGVAEIDSAARRFDQALAPLSGMSAADVARRSKALEAVNAAIYRTEQALADSAGGGLPRRPWFAHLIYAPGFYTGYGVKTMPGIREAVEQRQPAEAQAQAARVARALDAYAQAVNRAADLLAAALQRP
ncbi:MAG TPA: transferrin receptor-like dimerization domain-containing protein [Gemmatimonadales bacterium]|nr:transferrin receptor-like dimerization domain-containing protein [Gemmatimonadales bacterium]